ncbi:MAG: response regulator [Elusimicrobiota bacterium]|nr:MAG: response regulator [Elusimicrobiota bacterium]
MPYYVHEEGRTLGPFEARELVLRPGFKGTTLVCPAGATSADAWKQASAFPDVAKALDPNSSGIFLTAAPPRVDAEPPPPAPAPAAAPAAAPGDEGPKPGKPADKLLMIVDDDEAVRSFIETCATMQGFRVLTAVDGNDAVAKLQSMVPDLIITDLMMPGLGGYEFLRTLQGSGNSRIPIFIITGSALDDSTIKMIRAEANVLEFVQKPVKIAKFVAALHKTLKTAPV